MNKIYAGIESRETPKEILDYFTVLAKWLGKRDFTLRSGHADGADKAFETGCDKVNGKKEIYIPWKGFNGSNSNLIVSDPKAFEIAQKFHPYWNNLKDGAKKLQARNSHQGLGLDLETPCDFTICWTKGGKEIGGTAQMIRLCKGYNIPLFNCGCYTDIKEISQELKKFLINNNILTESDFN